MMTGTSAQGCAYATVPPTKVETADLILTSATFGHPQVTWRPLLIEPLRLVVPPRHPLARRKRIRLAEVADEPFILLREGYALRVLTERLCAQAGFTPGIAFEGEEVETLRALVAAGLGVALLPPARATPAPAPSADPDRGISTRTHNVRANADAGLGANGDETEPAPQLHVIDVDSTRELGLAWLAGRELPPASAAFRDHVLRSMPALAARDHRAGGA